MPDRNTKPTQTSQYWVGLMLPVYGGTAPKSPLSYLSRLELSRENRKEAPFRGSFFFRRGLEPRREQVQRDKENPAPYPISTFAIWQMRSTTLLE